MHIDHGKIRLALVTTELRVGGAERCLTNLATGLHRDHFDPLVVSLAPPPPAGHDSLLQQLQLAGIDVKFVNATSTRHSLRAVRTLYQHLRSFSPDIIQTFLFHANVVGGICARRMRTVDNQPVPLVMGIRVADPRRWRWRVERIVARWAARVVCVSDAVAKTAQERLAVTPPKLVTVPNGIATDNVTGDMSSTWSDLGIDDRRHLIAVAGRLDRQKGLDWLLGQVPGLVRECPDVQLLLIGDGPERTRLERHVQSLGMEPHVHFAGWRANVLDLLAECRLLVLPSRWEGMPNVVLEAMACGLPVVATRVEGVEQLLGRDTQRQTIEFGDSEALLLRVTDILRDDSLAERLGQTNRIRVEQEFSLDRMIQAYEQLYRELTRPAGHSRAPDGVA